MCPVAGCVLLQQDVVTDVKSAWSSQSQSTERTQTGLQRSVNNYRRKNFERPTVPRPACQLDSDFHQGQRTISHFERKWATIKFNWFFLWSWSISPAFFRKFGLHNLLIGGQTAPTTSWWMNPNNLESWPKFAECKNTTKEKRLKSYYAFSNLSQPPKPYRYSTFSGQTLSFINFTYVASCRSARFHSDVKTTYLFCTSTLTGQSKASRHHMSPWSMTPCRGSRILYF